MEAKNATEGFEFEPGIPIVTGFFQSGRTGTPTADPEDGCTLLVTNLPSDITRRELAQVFRAQPGFLDTQINTGHIDGRICSSVTYNTRENAERAMALLQNYQMDLSDPSSLIKIFFA